MQSEIITNAEKPQMIVSVMVSHTIYTPSYETGHPYAESAQKPHDTPSKTQTCISNMSYDRSPRFSRSTIRTWRWGIFCSSPAPWLRWLCPAHRAG